MKAPSKRGCDGCATAGNDAPTVALASRRPKFRRFMCCSLQGSGRARANVQYSSADFFRLQPYRPEITLRGTLPSMLLRANVKFFGRRVRFIRDGVLLGLR